jgi:hypothetical protein
MEEDVHAHYSTCTRERTGSVLHGTRFSRYEAFGHSIIRSKSGSIGLSQFSRLHRILLPQQQTENSEQALSALRRSRSASHHLAVRLLTARWRSAPFQSKIEKPKTAPATRRLRGVVRYVQTERTRATDTDGMSGSPPITKRLGWQSWRSPPYVSSAE